MTLVDRALGLLVAEAAACWVFGGWAEQLRGLCPPRRHKDLDLLYAAQSFAAVERMLAVRRLEEIKRKRFRHKRAFLVEGVMVELFLVERDASGLFTNFWGRCRHDWPADVLSSVRERPVASAAALVGYRSAHRKLSFETQFSAG